MMTPYHTDYVTVKGKEMQQNIVEQTVDHLDIHTFCYTDGNKCQFME